MAPALGSAGAMFLEGTATVLYLQGFAESGIAALLWLLLLGGCAAIARIRRRPIPWAWTVAMGWGAGHAWMAWQAAVAVAGALRSM
jgi:hypothetical protein